MKVEIEPIAIDGLLIWQIREKGPVPVRGVLISDGKESILVDCLTSGKALDIHTALERLPGVPLPERIVLTHCHGDHAGSAAALARRLDAVVYCGQQEVSYVLGQGRLDSLARSRWRRWMLRLYSLGPLMYGDPPGQVSPLVEGPFRFGWDVIDIPGHTPGQIALWHRETATLICGDGYFNFFGYLSADPFPAVSVDPDLERHSMDKMARMTPRHLIPAHGPVILDQAAERLRRFRR